MDSTVPIIRMKELKELFSSFPNAIGRDVLLVNDLDGKLVYNDTSVQVDAFAFAVFTTYLPGLDKISSAAIFLLL